MTTPSLTFTDAAAKKAKSLIDARKNSELFLRLYITGGGCSGFQYVFTLDNQKYEDDIVVTKLGISLRIDALSFQYLKGSTVDYVQELVGSRFVVQNVNAKTTCSCGHSFSV